MDDMRFSSPQPSPEATAGKATNEGIEEKKKWKFNFFNLKNWGIWQNIKNKMKIKKPNILSTVIFLVIIISVGSAVFFYFKAEKAQVGSPAAVASEIQKIVKEVGKLILLPTDETPTVATVQDPAKLRGQAFFANAKAGDKVLIYTKAEKAILYNPSAKIIIEVAPLNMSGVK
jgi:hypothetical protein